MFPNSDSHTYKVVATWTSGKKATFNYITSVEDTGSSYLLTGQSQTDGTMEQRSFVLERSVVAFLDVRKISSVRTMSNGAQDQGFAPADAEGDDQLASF